MIVIIIIIFILLNIFLSKIEYYDNPENINIYFINLDRSEDRLNNMLKQCNNLNCIKVSGIDGLTFDLTNIQYEIHNNKLRNTDIACFLSHLKSLEKIIENDDKYAIILEDDIILPNNFIERLLDIKKELPTNYDIIYLGGTRICGEKYSENIIKQKQINTNCNAGAFAYIITNKCANFILNKIKNDGIYKMYDHQLRDYFDYLNIYYINPPLVKHNFDLVSDRKGMMYKENYINNSQIILLS